MSGVYIPMKLPETCLECPLETDYGTCGFYSLFVEAGHDSMPYSRRDDCPLVPVPPHGRLIDADAMSEDCPFCLYEKTEENCPGCFEGSNYRPKLITNADRIRGMSDEELAEWLADILNHCDNKKPEELCHMSCPLYKCCNDQPSDNIEDWLKSPVEVSE